MINNGVVTTREKFNEVIEYIREHLNSLFDMISSLNLFSYIDISDSINSILNKFNIYFKSTQDILQGYYNTTSEFITEQFEKMKYELNQIYEKYIKQETKEEIKIPEPQIQKKNLK